MLMYAGWLYIAESRQYGTMKHSSYTGDKQVTSSSNLKKSFDICYCLD